MRKNGAHRKGMVQENSAGEEINEELRTGRFHAVVNEIS